MLDYLHLPKPQNGTIDYFSGFSNSDGASWVVWEKPNRAIMVRITTFAGGAGGGSGYHGNGGPAGGGGGGGPSSVSIVMMPAYALPDRLYISCGVGGIGGASPSPGTANLGTDGIRSYVCIAPDTANIYRVAFADSGKAGTAAATSAAGGNGGFGGSIISIANMQLAAYGMYNFLNGSVYTGGDGGSPGVKGADVSYSQRLLLSAGSGGTGTGNFGASQILAPTQTEYVVFSSIGQVSPAGPPQPGIEIYQPLLSTGGSSSYESFPFPGGQGGFGSGGAGGYGGSSSGGAGGNGGPGLIIIHSW